jgi:predicted AlkP superfamily pyrophosphatase or phosphodiesterase
VISIAGNIGLGERSNEDSIFR